MSAITFPTSTQATLLSFVGDQLTDPGFLTLIVLAIGIPLVFYVAKKLIGLIPKGK